MTPERIESISASSPVPAILTSWLAVFRPCFSGRVWNHVLVLVAGAILAPGKRTVTQSLRVMGPADEPGFGRYHEALNRARAGIRAMSGAGCCAVFLMCFGLCRQLSQMTLAARWTAARKLRAVLS
jgi:hypothetical protein